MTRWILLVVLTLPPAVAAADWPQFRGPRGAGVADDTPLPIRWSETENISWKVELPGRGLSNPVIANGRLYVVASSGPLLERLHVLCFEAADGTKLWERQLWATGKTLCHPKTSMASPTPCTDGRNVYTLFATGDLAAFDADGNLLWYRALARDYPSITNQVGMAASPVLIKDVLVVPMDNAGESFLAGLDKHTGQNRWRVERSRDINWTTPLIFTVDGQAEVLFLSGKDLTSYDPETGETRWTYEGAGLSTIPSPVAAGELVLLPGGVALRPRPNQSPEVAWQSPKLRTNTSSPIFYRGRVYYLTSAPVLSCADPADGKVLWQLRVQGQFWASPVAANGKLYLLDDDGVMTVVEVGEKEGRILARNTLPDSNFATPAIADGAIYLRSDKYLYCIAEPKRR